MAKPSERQLKVLFTFWPLSGVAGNPYTQMLADAVDVIDDCTFFSWRAAFTRRFDLVHLHWPENLVRHKSPAVRFAKRILFLFLLLKWRVDGTALVETVHNEEPHESGSWLEQIILKLKDKRVIGWVNLNRFTTRRPPKSVVIPHGHYVDWYRKFSESDSHRENVLYFGHLREYKGLLPLVDAYKSMSSASASSYPALRLIGSAHSKPLVEELRESTLDCKSIELVDRAVSDLELVREILRAKLVVLPYENMGNSGAVLAALSLSTPVLVPKTPTTEDLQAEVGRAWVHTYSGQISPDVLRAAIAWAERCPDRELRPNLSGRSWDVIAAQHHNFYLDIVDPIKSEVD